MKKLAKLKGIKTLSRMQQKSINGGGGVSCNTDSDCPRTPPGGGGCNPFCGGGTCIWSTDCNF